MFALRNRWALVATLCLPAIAGCGGGPIDMNAGVHITPGDTTVVVGKSQQFQIGFIEFPDSVTWSIQEGAAGGTIVPKDKTPIMATYTAPATSGIYHVVAHAGGNLMRTARVQVTQ